ncbi:transposase [Enterococcus faecalis]|uniref:transposase n=1 Tax=Enterococcus faecalis TaxID=1351 RepID=UPI003D0D34A7
MDNFKSPNRLLVYAGCEPSVSTSDMNQIETGHMVKRGSSKLRWALHEAARLMAVWSPSMRLYFDKKFPYTQVYLSCPENCYLII